MRLHTLLVITLLAGACGDDPPPPPPPPANGAAGAPPPGPGGGAKPKGPQLQPRMQIEDRVKCQAPEKPTGPACTPGTLTCEAGLYCVTGAKASSCEPCPERDSIRHDFKDRDFIPDQVRDPFQSYVIIQPGLNDETAKKVEGPCNRPDQFVAGNYSYLDLTLVGIVSKGTQRKVLMMDRGNLGHIIRRGDCVGKEKAVVKDIGAAYVTFVVQPDPEDKNPAKQSEERSVQLHPKALQVEAPPDTEVSAPSAPIVGPPGQPAPAPQPTVPAPSAK